MRRILLISVIVAMAFSSSGCLVVGMAMLIRWDQRRAAKMENGDKATTESAGEIVTTESPVTKEDVDQ